MNKTQAQEKLNNSQTLTFEEYRKLLFLPSKTPWYKQYDYMIEIAIIAFIVTGCLLLLICGSRHL